MKFDQQGHLLISPRQFQTSAFEDPDGLINHGLIPGVPLGFETYDKYTTFVDYISSNTGIHPLHLKFRGSTKIGFSISPDREKRKTWTEFGPFSDLDLAIVDAHFFQTLDEEVRQYDRKPANLKKVFRNPSSAEFRNYSNRIRQKGRHDCYRYFDLPWKVKCMEKLQSVLSDAPIKECCIHEFIELKAFIFRDQWALCRRYHTDLDDLRRGLTAKENPLPTAPDNPFPQAQI